MMDQRTSPRISPEAADRRNRETPSPLSLGPSRAASGEQEGQELRHLTSDMVHITVSYDTEFP